MTGGRGKAQGGLGVGQGWENLNITLGKRPGRACLLCLPVGESGEAVPPGGALRASGAWMGPGGQTAGAGAAERMGRWWSPAAPVAAGKGGLCVAAPSTGRQVTSADVLIRGALTQGRVLPVDVPGKKNGAHRREKETTFGYVTHFKPEMF